LRGQAEKVGHLLDDGVVDERAQGLPVTRPGLQRAAVEDDRGGGAARGGLGPAEGDRLTAQPSRAITQFGGGGNLLDGELDGRQLAAPAWSEPVDRPEDQVVEALASGPGDRHV